MASIVALTSLISAPINTLLLRMNWKPSRTRARPPAAPVPGSGRIGGNRKTAYSAPAKLTASTR
jgi:hypothetical protein